MEDSHTWADRFAGDVAIYTWPTPTLLQNLELGCLLAWSSDQKPQLHLGVDSPEGVWSPCISPGPWAGCPYLGPQGCSQHRSLLHGVVALALESPILWREERSWVTRRASISKAPTAAMALHGVGSRRSSRPGAKQSWSLGCSWREDGLEASEG